MMSPARVLAQDGRPRSRDCQVKNGFLGQQDSGAAPSGVLRSPLLPQTRDDSDIEGNGQAETLL